MVDAYRVPKRPLVVQIRTTHGGDEPVTVFLSEQSENHAGPETPLELFGGGQAFVPIELATGDVCFLSCDHIISVTLPPGIESTASEFCGVVVKVALVMVDGLRFEGGIAYEAPDSSSRIQDHLNNPVSFVELHTPDGVKLVNKRHIAHVSETN